MEWESAVLAISEIEYPRISQIVDLEAVDYYFRRRDKEAEIYAAESDILRFRMQEDVIGEYRAAQSGTITRIDVIKDSCFNVAQPIYSITPHIAPLAYAEITREEYELLSEGMDCDISSGASIGEGLYRVLVLMRIRRRAIALGFI